jgi:TatD DNase family protein
MWIDTHCHLDAPELNPDAGWQNTGQNATQSAAQNSGATMLAQQAAHKGVAMIVIPAVERANFASVATLAHTLPNACYALGIHPMYVARAGDDDLAILRQQVMAALADPRMVAIGEIGLDLFIPELKSGSLRERQEYFYCEQLKLAREFGLPVLLHVRRSQDEILKQLRRLRVVGGIAHAFNGSFQQAQIFIDLGFKLGLGGAMTFTRALQIRRLASELPFSALVLETDAPDIAPSWLHPALNTPEQIPAIGQVLADLRGVALAQTAQQTSSNALAVLPRMAGLINLPPFT